MDYVNLAKNINGILQGFPEGETPPNPPMPEDIAVCGMVEINGESKPGKISGTFKPGERCILIDGESTLVACEGVEPNEVCEVVELPITLDFHENGLNGLSPLKYNGAVVCSDGGDCSVPGCSEVKYIVDKNGVKTAHCVDADQTDLYDFPDEPTEDQWVKAFMRFYDEDATSSTMSLPNVELVPMASKLKFSSDNTTASATNIGTAIANYWAAQITPGSPSVGVSVALVVNNAAMIAPIITAGLLSLSGKAQPDENPYESMFSIIEDAVKTIVWMVTEIMPAPAPPVVVPVMVS